MVRLKQRRADEVAVLEPLRQWLPHQFVLTDEQKEQMFPQDDFRPFDRAPCFDLYDWIACEHLEYETQWAWGAVEYKGSFRWLGKKFVIAFLDEEIATRFKLAFL